MVPKAISQKPLKSFPTNWHTYKYSSLTIYYMWCDPIEYNVFSAQSLCTKLEHSVEFSLTFHCRSIEHPVKYFTDFGHVRYWEVDLKFRRWFSTSGPQTDRPNRQISIRKYTFSDNFHDSFPRRISSRLTENSSPCILYVYVCALWRVSVSIRFVFWSYWMISSTQNYTVDFCGLRYIGNSNEFHLN